MESITLEATTRNLLTTGKLNDTRRGGWIPAVLYGSAMKAAKKGTEDNVLLQVSEKVFVKTLVGHQWSNMILSLKWDKESANVLVREIQRDVVTNKLIHIDFQRVAMDKQIEVMVPLHLSGEAPGVKLSGGIMEHITREIRISSLPKDIPNQIEVDVSHLEIGQGIHLKDVKEIPGVQILSDQGLLIVNIVAPTILEETTTAAPAATEPEVIAKGKKPEEGEAGAAAAAPAAGGKAPDKAGAAAPAKDKGAAPGK